MTTYPEVWKIWASDEVINWIAFGPQGQYVVDTPSKIYAWRADKLIRTYMPSQKQVPVRCASFGYGGAWVIVEDDGCIRSHELADSIRKAMMQGNVRVSNSEFALRHFRKSPRQNIQLSQVNSNHYYIEFMNGTSDWSLPVDWHDAVKGIEGKNSEICSPSRQPPFTPCDV